MLFLSHRIILVNLPNTLIIITRQMTIKEINPLQAVQRFLELFIKDDTECFVGRKRFLATSLFIPSTERTAGSVTSLFDDAIMSSLPNLLVRGLSLSFSLSCILQLFTVYIYITHLQMLRVINSHSRIIFSRIRYIFTFRIFGGNGR